MPTHSRQWPKEQHAIDTTLQNIDRILVYKSDGVYAPSQHQNPRKK